MQALQIRIEKLAHPEPAGDWHDAPLRWVVKGPAKEAQAFSTKAQAIRYSRIRRRASDQAEAIHAFVS